MNTLTQQRITWIQERLTATFAPTLLQIIDESELHKGHPGAQNGAGHFKIIIASALFQNKDRITCHRLIYAALQDMMETHIHALQIDIQSK